MRKVLLTLLFALTLSVTVFSQTPKPTPTEEDDVVRISTNLIQLDVTVTDKKGKVIDDLKPSDFEIFENGKVQKITNFTYISSNQPTQKKAKSASPIGIPIPPSKIRKSGIRRTIALVVDDLTLSFGSTFWVKKALEKFVDKQMQDGDLVAIIRTGDGIGALQQFTTDKQQLRAAIKKVKFNLRGTGRVSFFNPIEPSLNEQLNGTRKADGSSKNLGKDIERDQDFENNTNNFRENIFARGTLGAINFIIRGMNTLPGRKSVMLLSDGFPLIRRDRRGTPSLSSGIYDSLRRLTDLANRASVVIYTVDAKGLTVPGLNASDDVAGLSNDQVSRRLRNRFRRITDSQDGLRYLADETGGFAVINNNNISKSIRRVLNDQSYYLIGYQPEEETFDPKTRRFNKINIKVGRKDTKVRYRSGFFGISEEEIRKPVVTTPIQKLLNALTSPFAVNEIPITMNNVFVSDGKKALFVRSYLHIPAKQLSFTKEKDHYKVTFDLISIVYGNNGKVENELSQTYSFQVTERAFNKIQTKGFVYSQTIPFKKPGGYQIRLALRDSATNKVGSANQYIEIPKLRKKRLTLSGIVLENLSFEQFNRLNKNSADYLSIRENTNPQLDTALRQFASGTILRIGFDIYNAKVKKRAKPDLVARLRVIKDGEVYYASKDSVVIPSADGNYQKATKTFSLRLGKKMLPGDYIIQVIATDRLAKKKRQIATQYLQFEIVE